MEQKTAAFFEPTSSPVRGTNKIRIGLVYHDAKLANFRPILNAFEADSRCRLEFVIGVSRSQTESVYGPSVCDTRIQTTKSYVRDSWFHPINAVDLTAARSVDVLIVLEEPWSWNLILFATIARCKWNVPVLFYSFQNIFESPTAELFREEGLSAASRKSLRFLLGDLGLMPLRSLLVSGGAYSYQECLHVLRRFGFAANTVQAWWPVVAAKNTLRPREPLRSTDIKRIGFIGRFCKEKGIEMLMSLADTEQNFEFVFVGDGPMREKLEQLQTRRKNVAVVGPLLSGEVAKIISNLDLVVLPSKTTPTWKEQFGRVIVEAWKMEVPVCGSNSGAIPFVISDRRFIFNEGDLKSCLTCIHGSLALGFDAQREVAQKVIADASPEKFVESFLYLYSTAIKSEVV